MAQTILCTICARGGSKGIPNKNIREVGGKPLLGHTVEHALKWGRSTDIVVSTDNQKIAAVGEQFGATVPFMRPEHLASDDAAKLPVIQHAYEEMVAETGRDYDYVVDLSVTTPLRVVSDIENCFRTVHNTDARNAYTVTEADVNPYFNMVELDEDGYASISKESNEPIIRRQDAPEVYAINAAVYVYEESYLRGAESVHGKKTRVTIMPPKRSVDIDRPIDLKFARFLIESGMNSHD